MVLCIYIHHTRPDMEKYVIRFRYEMKFEDRIFKSDEFFEPYEVSELISIIGSKNPICDELVKTSERRGGFNQFAKRIYEQRQADDCIVKMYEDNEVLWINESTETEANSLWDYIADALTVVSMYRFSKNEFLSVRIGKHAELTLLSRIHLAMAKFDLSLLTYCAWNTDNHDLEEKIVEFYDWIIDIITNVQFAKLQYRQDEFEESIGEYLESLIDIRVSGNIKNICDWTRNIFRSEELTDQQVSDVLKTIKQNFAQIIPKLGIMYETKGKFIKRIKSVHDIKISKHDIFKMTVSQQQFEEKKIDLFCEIIHSTNQNNSNIPHIDDPNFEAKFERMRKFFEDTDCIQGRTTIGKNVLNRYKDKESCFAMLIEKGGINYFSFSNVNEYEKYETKYPFEDLAKKLMETVLDPSKIVPIGDVRRHIYMFNWAYLSDSTLRYNGLGERDENANYLSKPVELGNDSDILDWENQKGDIGTSYACCERKILAFSNNKHNKTFFVRWAPCFKCRPALVSSSYNLKIYALANDYNSWIASGKPMDLCEYEVLTKYEVRKK